MDSMDIHEILQHLPHRYPFLLIDRVTDYSIGEYLVAIKNVSFNEPFFQGHFPIRPVMPGVLVVEAMAQATGVLSFKTAEARPEDGSLYYLAGIDKARFKQPVEPGDQLVITVTLQRTARGVWKYEAVSKVDDKVVATADLMCIHREVQS
ncbi:3-hydroxyacyl-ACP dehydratase FabZ [Candidatus Venteria ishoeyi]|uniref:3-hydroxyacyl-[acyl-carrier-protein] dehydratase FabZ n=1 Tax=Candidatus Venteria ishoeyi TaxID=1899563 RepID=A0A1H6F738_9GAMM|nr:3-hydroxyacyl-ACP dehydratase FabZ [Candidatus Venteria ishoeyi]MDM8547990.1 3-hydroxyacyl-ACP dehydratase FabZ [Candidatus Venteria ishoeyi]SEH05947.1 3-hydroxyacyl-[acyl-carrier-protein] dehydratase FabZ [Candidatus Venteria ishoeyi]